jgi:sugar O-acyltransferase (sialic acid O-acetyltransferase NeuD family)
MTTEIFIFGAGGHAAVIAAMLDRDPVFVVPKQAGPGQISEAAFFADAPRSAAVYIGIGGNAVRLKVFEAIRADGRTVASCIAPSATIARSADLGQGVVICPGAVVGPRARIGSNTIINTLSSVDHDCTLGDHSQVTAGVTFGGDVTVGTLCFFGIKSAVIPGCRIGDRVTVMAGSLVATDLASNVLAGGNPARVMKAQMMPPAKAALPNNL